MKIKFDSGQPFQLDAISAVCDVFEGQPLAQTVWETSLAAAPGELFSELGIGNALHVSEDALLANVQAVQARNEIAQPTAALDGINFSVEMETGTGKTYVYLRTMYELATRYGFKKFIVVVPSVAIREGVWQSINLLKEHFADLYDNLPVSAKVYESKKVSDLREFAASNKVQLLIMNIQAFNSDATILQKETETRRPIEYIQAARPVIIMDEPQNMETEIARRAIASLHPVCTLRYSATHKNPYNLLYRLDPVKAYDLGLVKRIEVDSVLQEADFNQPFIQVKNVKATTTKVTARLLIDVQQVGGPQRKEVTLKASGDDLFELSGGRSGYRGYVVDDIRNEGGGQGVVTFTNGVQIGSGETHGGRTEDLMRVQVRQTIRRHLDKELAIMRLPEGERLKVLSLFFIDRVVNYAPADGKIRAAFNEEYATLRAMPKYGALPPDATGGSVHDGYFAQDKEGAKDTSGATKADDMAYQLIMRDKERLLRRDVPLRFIFTHSALREGWDNPNVFQICTLRDIHTQSERRQTVGRGLRLPVRENGERCFDPNINRLTVVANESYQDFAAQLQTEIENECGVSFAGRIKDARDRQTATLKKDWRLNTDFVELWNRIKHRTRYKVEYSTTDLIKQAAEALHNAPPITTPQVTITSTELDFERDTKTNELQSVGGTLRGTRNEKVEVAQAVPLPDLLAYLQNETELTRTTIAEVLIQSGRLKDVLTNPQQFLDVALSAILQTMQRLMVAGIKYEKVAGAEYEMLLFEEHEISGYKDRMLAVDNSVYDYLEYDSNVEYEFAKALDKRDDIKLFLKLPWWFKIETPLGTYNPDWAIVKEQDEKLYLVRETKGTSDINRLRTGEKDKITCGKRHFDTLGVDYSWTMSASSV